MIVKKLDTPIEVQETLDVGPFFQPVREDGMQYKVRAIVVHIGEEGDGHYLCYFRQNHEKDSEEAWWCLDDDKAKRCGDVDAVRASDEVLKGAFLLLYEACEDEVVNRSEAYKISKYLFDAVVDRNERLCSQGLLGLYEER